MFGEIRCRSFEGLSVNRTSQRVIERVPYGTIPRFDRTQVREVVSKDYDIPVFVKEVADITDPKAVDICDDPEIVEALLKNGTH